MIVCKKVHVQVDGRQFVVEFDRANDVIRIKERKPKLPPMLGVYETPYWSASHHSLGKKETSLPNRIVTAAKEKANA